MKMCGSVRWWEYGGSGRRGSWGELVQERVGRCLWSVANNSWLGSSAKVQLQASPCPVAVARVLLRSQYVKGGHVVHRKLCDRVSRLRCLLRRQMY